MHLHITPARLITEVQKEFNSMFPFLKLEFFKNIPALQAGAPLRKLIPHNKKIGEVLTEITDGDIDIKEEMKVNELENIFKDRFGINMQIFRRSGNLWLETTMTDNWTLRQQNEHGKEISSATAGKNILSADEYDLSRGEER